MKKINKKFIFLIGGIIIIIIVGFLMYFIYSNQNIEHVNSSEFDQRYKIFEESIDNNKSFNYTAEIVSQNDQDDLTCLNIYFYDEDKNILLSYNNYINIKITQESGYKINVKNDDNLDVKYIEYDLCDEN